MRNMAQAAPGFISAVRKNVVLPLGFVTASVVGTAFGVEMDGVVYVDDIQQAMRASNAAGQQQTDLRRHPMPGRAPSAHSRYPQPQVQRMPSQESEEQKPSWTSKLGLRKPFGGWFGGSVDKANSANEPGRARTSSTREAIHGSARKRPDSTGRVSANSPQIRRSATRVGGIQERPTTAGNQPRGLLQLLGSKSTPEHAGSGEQLGSHAPPTERSRQVATAQQRPKQYSAGADRVALPLGTKMQSDSIPDTQPKGRRSPAEWDGSDSVAVISDQDTPPEVAARGAAGSGIRLASQQTPQPTGDALPQVMPSPLTSDSVAATTPKARASSMPQDHSLRPVQEQLPGTRTVTSAGPEEIVNRHAMAASSGPANSAAKPEWKATGTAAKPAAATPDILPRHAPFRRPVAMPENPVTAQHESAKPTDKAIELLAEANRLSKSAVSEEDYTTVIQLCRHVLAIDDSEAAESYSHDLAAWALNRRGEIKADDGRSKEALLDFEDALRLDPQRWRAIHNRGVLAAQAGRFADAFDDFNRTLEMNPKFAKAYSNRAALYVQAGKLEEASDDYRQAIAFDPDLAVAHKGRGRVCHMLGQFELALQHFDAAALLSPEDARIVNNRGDLLSDMGRYRAAMTSYEEAVELDTSLAVAYRNLAWLQATCPDKECRDPALALQNAQRAMQLCDEPSDLEYDSLAAAHAAAGDFESAKAMMDKAIELAPDDDKPNYQWRRGLYERGQAYVTEPASSIQQASYADE